MSVSVQRLPPIINDNTAAQCSQVCVMVVPAKKVHWNTYASEATSGTMSISGRRATTTCDEQYGTERGQEVHAVLGISNDS
jgi:hypothetical protein